MKKEYLKVVWSDNTILPTAEELNLGPSNRYKDFTYRVELHTVEYDSDKKEDIQKYKLAIQKSIDKL